MGRVPGRSDGSSLFQVREPRRRFLVPFVGVVLVHVGIAQWAGRPRPLEARSLPEPVKVVFKLPVQRMAIQESPGGGPKVEPPRPRHHRRHPVRTPKEIPPPVVEAPTPPPPPEPPALAEADEGDDTDDGSAAAEGSGTGGGSGTGSGPVTGSGRGSVASKARKAWVSHTDWKCLRPGYDDLGRIVVRIRVEVQPNGRPAQVLVVKPGPEPFNRRAIDCARDETYLPALDPDGRPISGDCEFGIEFLN